MNDFRFCDAYDDGVKASIYCVPLLVIIHLAVIDLRKVNIQFYIDNNERLFFSPFFIFVLFV